jgi:hypothetical protein
MSYQNTTETLSAELREYQYKATTQESMILDFFNQRAPCEYPPSQVLYLVFRGAVPLTSVRRAMTELTNELRLL